MNYNSRESDTLFLFSLFYLKESKDSLKKKKKEVKTEDVEVNKNSKIYDLLSKENKNEPWISGKIAIKKFNNFNIKSITSIPPYKTLKAQYYAYYIEFNQQNYGGILLEPSRVKEDDDLYSTSSYYTEGNHIISDSAKYNFYEYLREYVFNDINYIYISIPTPTKEIDTIKLVNISDQKSIKSNNIEENFWINPNKECNKHIENPFFPMLFKPNSDNTDKKVIRKLITGNFDPTIDEEMSKLMEAKHLISNENNISTTYKYYFAPDADGCAITSTGNTINPRTMLQCLNIFVILILQRTIISTIKHKCLTLEINKKTIRNSKHTIILYKEKLNSLREYGETALCLPSISGSFAHHLYKKETYDMISECDEANKMCNSVLRNIDEFKQGKLDLKLNIVAAMAIVSIVWDGLSLIEHIFHFTI